MDYFSLYREMIDHPKIFSAFPNIIAAQSTRLGGVSTGPFSSLNLGLSTGDTRENVEENRRLLFSRIGIEEAQLASSGQEHGKEILFAKTSGRRKGFDAIITNEKNLFVAVSIADCTPVLVYDAEHGAVAAIHAGWRGTVQQIVAATLQRMKEEFGTRGQNCYAYIGACIAECSFEVGAEVAERFDSDCARAAEAHVISEEVNEGASAMKSAHKYFVDLKRANKKQLTEFGIPPGQVEVSDQCTLLNNDRYFSFRLEKGNTGRMLAVIGMRP